MIIGWDISTSIIGVSFFTDDGKYVSSDHLDLRKISCPSNVEDLVDKSFAAEEWIDGIAERLSSEGHKDNDHYIEDRLGNFSFGKSMIQVLMKLAAFNSTVSYLIYRCFHMKECGGNMVHIHPSTVKAIMKKEGLVIPKGGDKKQLTLDFVVAKEPNFVVDKNRNDNPQPWNFDRADSYVIARAGYLRRYLSLNGPRKKTGAAEAGPQAAG